jgi:hypothetical protein
VVLQNSVRIAGEFDLLSFPVFDVSLYFNTNHSLVDGSFTRYNLCVTEKIYRSIYVSITLSVCLSFYGSKVILLDFGRLFSFLILYAVGRAPWAGHQPVARPLPTPRTTQTKKKRTQTTMP